mmetsp:Transcript_17771/g.19490  ORF Transcript_17771/g.19490 Transcript_17771/m.19490 type:complete len:404 (-) Transcript_17771:178-1389(-)
MMTIMMIARNKNTSRTTMPMNTRSMAAVCYCVCFLLGMYSAFDAQVQVQVATAYTTQIRPSHLQTQTWEPSVLVGKPTTTTTTTTSPTPIPSLLHKKNKKHNININRTTKEVAPMKKKEIATSMSSMWERLAEIKAADEIIEGTVLSVNAGGAIVQITSKDHHGIVKAFLPKSQVSMKSHTARRTELIGTVLPFKIVSIADYSYGSKHRRLVVSHKRAVAAQQQLWKTGDVVHDGVVTAITSYGAFISFHKGRRQGLLHKNNISHNDWKLVRTKNEDGYMIDDCFRNEWETKQVLLKVGSPVKCLIIRITKEGDDHRSDRISLSTEALEPEPGDMLCNPNMVFTKAAETATTYNDRSELENFVMNEIANEIATTNTLLPSSSSTTILTMNHNKNTNEHHLLRP